MRSDAIDQLLSTYLQMPARVSWKGALAESARSIFEQGRLELAGVAVLAMPFDRVVLEAERFQFIPGIPARISATRPRVSVSIHQRQVDFWLNRAGAPFELDLTEHGIEFSLHLAGLPVTRSQAELRVDRGWFVLKPRHAELLGFRNRLAWLFRTYVPLPRLAPQTRLDRIEHEAGALRLEMALGDFEDEITPGLVDRLQQRFLPFARGRGSGRGEATGSGRSGTTGRGRGESTRRASGRRRDPEIP